MYADGIDGLSSERITSEMIKLLSAPDPSLAVASMGRSGVLMHIAAGAAPDVISTLVHLEQSVGITPDPVRRIAALDGDRDRWRMSNAMQAALDARMADLPLAEIAYRHGADAATDRYLIEQASMTQPADPDRIASFAHAAVQVFPLKAADLMPDLQGVALGQALKSAQARWIASSFTLTKDDLL
jgi:poly(A) polymerase